MSSGAFPSSKARIHDVSSSVPAYPVQWTRYSSLHLWHQWSIREVKCDRVGARLCYDLVWSQKLISNFLRGMDSTEKLRLDIGLTPNREFRSQGSMTINQQYLDTGVVLLPCALVGVDVVHQDR